MIRVDGYRIRVSIESGHVATFINGIGAKSPGLDERFFNRVALLTRK